MIKILELLAFAVSAAAFALGAVYRVRHEMPKYYQLYVCAAGCYMLEELWVIVNSLLGNGSQDGLLTVRLFGFFGCLCFMLSANANEFDRMVDEGQTRRVRLLACAAPLFLLALFALYAFSSANTEAVGVIVAGFFGVSPALAASYYSLKHLLLPDDAMGFLKITRGLNRAALAFYAVNYLYPLLTLHCSGRVMSVIDVLVAGLLLGMIGLRRRSHRRRGRKHRRLREHL